MSHNNGSQSIIYFLNDSTHMTNYLRNFELIGLKTIINTFFYNKKGSHESVKS